MASEAFRRTAAFKQDMPPKGGYAPFNYERIPAKNYFKGRTMFAMFIAYQSVAWPYFIYQRRKFQSARTEERNIVLALEPMMLAERDRAWLKQIHNNREWEEELMKDIPGWEVGTLWGEKVYKTLDNPHPYVSILEHNIHSQNKVQKHMGSYVKYLNHAGANT